MTPPPWKKILVPVDFSDYSGKALKEARRLQQAMNAEVVVLHVTEPAFSGLRIQTEDFHLEAQNDARQRLAELINAHFPAGAAVSPLLKDGHPVEGICEAAKKISADVILLGTHGVSAVEHYLLGSVTENVVRHAPCALHGNHA